MEYEPRIGESTSNNYKKMLRKAVRAIRWLNKQVTENEIWRGRFVYKLERVEYFHHSTDEFPSEMKCRIGFYDKQTRMAICKSFVIDEFFISLVRQRMNKFVTELIYTRFGEDGIKPSTFDWTQVKVPVKDFILFNYYLPIHFSEKIINPVKWRNRGYV